MSISELFHIFLCEFKTVAKSGLPVALTGTTMFQLFSSDLSRIETETGLTPAMAQADYDE